MIDTTIRMIKPNLIRLIRTNFLTVGSLLKETILAPVLVAFHLAMMKIGGLRVDS